MALCMLMFTLLARVTLWTLQILNMSKNLHLGGHIVRVLFSIACSSSIRSYMYGILIALYL
jgi:hypothetical protein